MDIWLLHTTPFIFIFIIIIIMIIMIISRNTTLWRTLSKHITQNIPWNLLNKTKHLHVSTNPTALIHLRKKKVATKKHTPTSTHQPPGNIPKAHWGRFGKVLAHLSTNLVTSGQPQSLKGGWCHSVVQIHPKFTEVKLDFAGGCTPSKLTCPPKRDYFNRKYIFQPLIFRGHVSFSGSIWSGPFILNPSPECFGHFLL